MKLPAYRVLHITENGLVMWHLLSESVLKRYIHQWLRNAYYFTCLFLLASVWQSRITSKFACSDQIPSRLARAMRADGSRNDRKDECVKRAAVGRETQLCKMNARDQFDPRNFSLWNQIRFFMIKYINCSITARGHVRSAAAILLLELEFWDGQVYALSFHSCLIKRKMSL